MIFTNPVTVSRIFKGFETTQTYKDKNNLCAVTGEKAKYFDPLTGQHYSTIEAFKILREKYFQKEEDSLLFRIQTLSDLASQKKEKLKKLLISNQSNSSNSGINGLNSGKNIMELMNKIGIMKSEPIDLEKKHIASNLFEKIYIYIYI